MYQMASKMMEREISRIEQRVAKAEATNRFIVGVQESMLARAEQLRRLATAVASSQGDFDRLRKTRAVNNIALQRLEAFVTGLSPFYLPPRLGKKVRRR